MVIVTSNRKPGFPKIGMDEDQVPTPSFNTESDGDDDDDDDDGDVAPAA